MASPELQTPDRPAVLAGTPPALFLVGRDQPSPFHQKEKASPHFKVDLKSGIVTNGTAQIPPFRQGFLLDVLEKFSQGNPAFEELAQLAQRHGLMFDRQSIMQRLGGLKAKLGQGTDLIKTAQNDKGTPIVIFNGTIELIGKEPEKSQEKPKPKYIALSDKDRENITNPKPAKLTEGDVRVLATLLTTHKNRKILVDDLARKIDPSKTSGFAKEIISIPNRVEFYNKVVLADTGLSIVHADLLNTNGGYYLDGDNCTANTPQEAQEVLQRRARILTEAVKRMEEAQRRNPNHEYGIVTKPLKNNVEASVSITKDGEATKPLTFKDVEFDDLLAPDVLLDGNGEATKYPSYYLKAIKQAKLLSLLFQSKPISTRVARNHLSDDQGPISKRELQFYIDILNGTLPSQITRELANQGIVLSDSLASLGLFVEVYAKEIDERVSEECLKLSIRGENTQRQEVSAQYDRTLQDPEITRERHRKPSHGKLKLG